VTTCMRLGVDVKRGEVTVDTLFNLKSPSGYGTAAVPPRAGYSLLQCSLFLTLFPLEPVKLHSNRAVLEPGC
jgi:hypothetical protein